MQFEKQKQDTLNKKDRSKKKSIDKDIKKLVDLINSLPDFYTTSSCSGRILLISFPGENRKYNVKWPFVSHDKVKFSGIKSSLGDAVRNFNKNKIKDDVWLKQESMILHVCCRTLKSASDMIETAKHIGFKRSGINTISNKILLEILSTERIEVPVVKEGKLLVNDDYLKVLVKEANKKMIKNKEKIKKFYEKVKSTFSS